MGRMVRQYMVLHLPFILTDLSPPPDMLTHIIELDPPVDDLPSYGQVCIISVELVGGWVRAFRLLPTSDRSAHFRRLEIGGRVDGCVPSCFSRANAQAPPARCRR